MKFLDIIKTKIQSELDLIGILDGQWAFMGPELVQIDLTNACNNDCIACWCRSPLLKSDRISEDIGQQTLPFGIVRHTLEDCARMGTSNVYLAGGGEPFMHPQIMEVIGCIKKLGMVCHVNTNFTLVDGDRIRNLVKMNIDHLVISLWAATPETYAHTHPNKTEFTFNQLTERIREIVELKKGGAPHIVLYNVIMNENFHEIEKMVDLATNLGVDTVEFAVADVIPGKTDKLLLNKQQRKQALASCQTVIANLSSNGKIGGLEVRIEDFSNRLASLGAASGNYDSGVMLKQIPCNIGWVFSRIMADGNVNGCLKAHRIPVGNLYKETFRQIWNNPKQRRFRIKTQKGDTSDSFFRYIGNDETAVVGCNRGCDDIERNRRVHNRLLSLSKFEKLALKGSGIYLRIKNLFDA